MKLVFQNENQSKYFYRTQLYQSFTCKIGGTDKRGHTLLYVIYITHNKVFILSSWSDIHKINVRLNKLTLYDHYKYFKRSIKTKLSDKLIDLAYKIKK